MAPESTPEGTRHLPGYLGSVILQADASEIRAELAVRPELMAPNGFLHAGSVVTLADTAAGSGCVQNLPLGASGFTTIESKSNHLGTVRDGSFDCVARPVHLGKTTQAWEATVTARDVGKLLALFRFPQRVLHPT